MGAPAGAGRAGVPALVRFQSSPPCSLPSPSFRLLSFFLASSLFSLFFFSSLPLLLYRSDTLYRLAFPVCFPSAFPFERCLPPLMRIRFLRYAVVPKLTR
jgi:hypothetical protein